MIDTYPLVRSSTKQPDQVVEPVLAVRQYSRLVLGSRRNLRSPRLSIKAKCNESSYWDIWLLKSKLFFQFSSAHTLSICLSLSLNLFCTKSRSSNFLGSIGFLDGDEKLISINIMITRKTPIIQLFLAVFFTLLRYSFLSFSYIVKLVRCSKS